MPFRRSEVIGSALFIWLIAFPPIIALADDSIGGKHGDPLIDNAFFTVVFDGVAEPGRLTETIVNCPAGSAAISGGLDVVDVEDSAYVRTFASAPIIDSASILDVPDGTYPTSTAWRLKVRNTKEIPVPFRAAAVCTTLEGSEIEVATRSGPRFKDQTVRCTSRIVWGGGFDSVAELFVWENAFVTANDALGLMSLPPGSRYRHALAWRVEALESPSEEAPLKVVASCAPRWSNLSVTMAVTGTRRLEGGSQRIASPCHENEAAVGQAVASRLNLASYMTSSPTFGDDGIRLGELPPGRAPAPRGGQSVTEIAHGRTVTSNLAVVCVDIKVVSYFPLAVNNW